MTNSRWVSLPCGTDPERLLTYVADRTNPDPASHEANCTYCQATISELAELWHPVTQWAGRDIPISRHFAAAVVSRVQQLLQSPSHASTTSARGTTSVTSWVLGLIASAATRGTPGVAKITGAPVDDRRRPAIRYGADGVTIDETGTSDITISLGITVEQVPHVAEVAEVVRHNVMNAIREQAHINAAEVDISIDDIDNTPLS